MTIGQSLIMKLWQFVNSYEMKVVATLKKLAITEVNLYYLI